MNPFCASRMPRTVALLTIGVVTMGAARVARAQRPDLAQQVEVRRTAYCVPHLRADNLGVSVPIREGGR
ncbi:MAG TPA: hypothetical protein VK939_15240 [Longimicrobiales bacterium]|nr:hypothetical protein [Longimicrobiales bacterium]